MAENRLTLNDADPDDFNGVRDRIVNLAGMGYSAARISQQTGENYKKVCRILNSEFQERCSERQNVVQAIDQNLMWLQLKCARVIEETSVDSKGNAKIDYKAGELFLKIADRRARLHGADKPVEHKVEIVQEQFTEEELITQLNQAGFHISLPAQPAPLPAHVDVTDAEYTHLVEERTQDRPVAADPDPTP